MRWLLPLLLGLTAQRDMHDRLSQDLARHLMDLGFTYHEARNRFLDETEVLLRAMTDSVLPDLARGTIGHAVVAMMMSASRQATDLAVVLCVAKADRAAIEAALPPDLSFPLSLVEDPGLEPGQAHLTLGGDEHRFDIASIVSEIRSLIDAFLIDQGLKDASYG